MDICSHDAVDAPIVLEDDGPDTELDAATSDDDDDRTLGATPPPDANDPHISVPDVPAKPVVNGQAQGSATSDGQSLSDRSVKPKGVNAMHQSWPSMYQQPHRSSSSPSSEIMEGSAQDTPHTEAPAAAGHIHDIFAEDEKEFGVDSLTRKSGQPKGRSSSSPRCTNPVCDGCLSLNNPSQQSVQDDHGLRDLDRTITASPAKAGSDGLSAGCLMERDGGAPGPEIEDLQRLEPTGANWKRSNRTESAFTETVRPTYRVPCAVPQAVLWLIAGGGAEGEGGEGDVSALGFPQRGNAMACIPTPLPGQGVGCCRPSHICGRGRLFEL